jgi:hypothetical protein
MVIDSTNAQFTSEINQTKEIEEFREIQKMRNFWMALKCRVSLRNAIWKECKFKDFRMSGDEQNHQSFVRVSFGQPIAKLSG